MLFKGIVVNMLSPINDEGKVHKESVKKLISNFKKNGIAGIWALGSAGEDINLSYNYRKEYANILSKNLEPSIPVVIGLGNSSYEEIIEFSNNNFDKGFSGFHCLLYDQKLGDSRAVDYLIKIANNIKLPLWLYNNPKRGKLLSLDSIKELSDHPNIRGIKVGGYDMTFITKTIMLQNDNFQVMAAGGGQLFQSISLGAYAHSSSDANVWPHKLVEIYNEFYNGSNKVALKLQFEHIKFSSQFPKTDNGERSAEEKYIASLLDLCSPNVNSAYRNFNEKEKIAVKKILKQEKII